MATRRQLKQTSNIKLPDLIPCNQCGVLKRQAFYSATRLEDLRKYIIQAGVKDRDFDPAKGRFICCSLCLGGPAVEHECYHCNITFPRTSLYFSKNMLKNNKDEALCWSCSQRQQNETLSSGGSDDDDDSGNGSDDTNPVSTTNDSSGGVPVYNSNASLPGTIYTGGSSSVASRSTAAPSVSESFGALRLRDDDKSSIMSSNATTTKRSFNPTGYGDPGHRSHTGSVVSGDSTKKSSPFAKLRAVPSKVNSDAAYQQKKEMRKTRPAAKKQSDDDDGSDVFVADSDDDDELVAPPKAAGGHASGKGSFSKLNIQAVAADKDQEGWDQKLASKTPKRQTTTDISRAVYGQEEAYHEIANFSDGSLFDDNEDYDGGELDEGFHG